MAACSPARGGAVTARLEGLQAASKLLKIFVGPPLDPPDHSA
jgi:hypothetical protein